MYYPSFSNPCLVLASCADRNQHGQEILDSLAEIKISIMTRYDQWRADHSSIQSSDPTSQPLLAHPKGINAMTNVSSSVPVLPNSGLSVATSTSESSGLITGHLQMPLQSTWCVGHIFFACFIDT